MTGNKVKIAPTRGVEHNHLRGLASMLAMAEYEPLWRKTISARSFTQNEDLERADPLSPGISLA